jgi:hypothetical protein
MSTPTHEGMMADPVSQRPKRGRKAIGESQASAIRTRLVSWRQTPETSRISLRALASELGTSHQLLAFYLRGLDKWQKTEYQRLAKAIRDRARAENRYMTPWERSQEITLERSALVCMMDEILAPTLKQLEADAKAGALSKQALKMVVFLARRGVPIAQKILEKRQINLPPQPVRRR